MLSSHVCYMLSFTVCLFLHRHALGSAEDRFLEGKKETYVKCRVLPCPLPSFVLVFTSCEMGIVITRQAEGMIEEEATKH